MTINFFKNRVTILVTLIILILIATFYFFAKNQNQPQNKNASISGIIEGNKGKVLYVDFWASWCKPCLKSFPWMVELSKKFSSEDLTIITFNMDLGEEGIANAMKFAKKQGVDFKIYYAMNRQILKEYGALSLPTSYLFDSEGNEMNKFVGFNEDKKKLIEEQIKKLIKN